MSATDRLAAIRARAAYLRGMQKDAIDHAYTVSPTDASVCGKVGHDDVPRMADALDAVLALAAEDEFTFTDEDGNVERMTAYVLPRKIRAAIADALGEDS